MINCIFSTLIFFFQEAGTESSGSVMVKSVKHPDLSKFLVMVRCFSSLVLPVF